MADLNDIAGRVIGWAEGDEQMEVVAVRGSETDIEVYDGGIESLSSADSLGVGIRVIVEGREGFAYTSTFDEAELRATLAEARDNAAFSEPDEFNGVATPDGVAPAPLDLYRASLASVATDDKVQLAIDLEAAIKAADERIRAVPSASYGDGIFEGAVVTTTGISAESREGACYVSAYALAASGPDDTQSGFGFSVGRELGDLDVAEATGDTVERATRLLGAKKPKSQRLTVVLDPFVAAQFLGVLSATLNGESVLKGRSLFADRMDDEVAAAAVTLVDDPTLPDAFTASQFDAEGLASRRNELIAGGVLRSFVHNSYTGRRAGTASTGNATRSGFKSTPGVGCRALSLDPGTMSQEEILAAVGDGLLVQSVSGMHSGVNPISGDFSTGAEGLMIRDGQLAEPVRELTIASTIQKMLLGISHIGNDRKWLPMSAAGVTVAITDVTMSGT